MRDTDMTVSLRLVSSTWAILNAHGPQNIDQKGDIACHADYRLACNAVAEAE